MRGRNIEMLAMKMFYLWGFLLFFPKSGAITDLKL